MDYSLVPTSPEANAPVKRDRLRIILWAQLSPFFEALSSPYGCLATYFVANLSLTLYNKTVLNRFPFPWTLTALHALSGSLGAAGAWKAGVFEQSALSMRNQLWLVGFSTLYTVNIAVSNLSLHLVTVPLHQVVRAITPLLTIALSVIILRKAYSLPIYASLLVVVIGVGFATYGDYYCTVFGFAMTFLGAFLAAVKGIATNLLMVGDLKLHPMDLLLRMSPLAFVQCILIAWITGESSQAGTHIATEMSRYEILALVGNAALAFLLNVVSFTGNKKNGPLTMTVAANVKQVMTVLLATLFFNLRTTYIQAFGIAVTLIGGALYGLADLRAKEGAVKLSSPLLPTSSPISSPSVSEKASFEALSAEEEIEPAMAQIGEHKAGADPILLEKAVRPTIEDHV